MIREHQQVSKQLSLKLHFWFPGQPDNLVTSIGVGVLLSIYYWRQTPGNTVRYMHNCKFPDNFIDLFEKGEETAFDLIFREYFEPLTFSAYKYLCSRKDAEDIVQECFLDIWKNRTKLNHVASVKSYLFKAVFNRCINFKKQKSVDAVELIDDHPTHELTIEELIISTESVNQILQVVNSLPPRTQKVFRLSVLEEKSCREISEALGTGIKTVERQRLRAIQILRKIIITGRAT